MAVRWEPLWKPRAEAFPISSIDDTELPVQFQLGVVFGPSGSGKSAALQRLAAHYGLEASAKAFDFPARMAVCSHPDMQHEAIDRLGCVGLNRVPSWCKPARVLSDGERQRVLSALTLRSGAILDDFAVVVDNRNASSMAASLKKHIQNRKLHSVLVATTKRCVLPFLAPDFVIFAEGGVVASNPFPPGERSLSVTITPEIDGFEGGKGGGWRGPVDDRPLRERKDLGAGPDRTATTLQGGARPKALTVEVDIDDDCHAAADAFDYEFDGTIEQKIFELDLQVLSKAMGTDGWSLGAIVGPSGTGKSCNMRQLCAGQSAGLPVAWDHRAVIEQFHHDKDTAAVLAKAVALPEAVALRPFSSLSSGEQSRAELAKRLGAGSPGEVICLDEFTSCLDRTTARQVCKEVSLYLRSASTELKAVVATVHEDILPWLLPDWVFESGSGTVTTFTGPMPGLQTVQRVHARLDRLPRSLSKTTGLDGEQLRQLLQPPHLSFTLRRLEDCSASRRIYADVFEEHHYLKGQTPTGLHGLLLRDELGRPAAFHGIAKYVGKGCTSTTMRESRLVVLPDAQGFGIGPRLSNCVGSLLVSFGAQITSRTAHPRLGSYRENHPELWHPTCSNRKATGHSMGSSLRASRAKTSTHLVPDIMELVPDIMELEDVGVGSPAVPEEAASFDASCAGCQREKLLAEGGAPKPGRPPKHICLRMGTPRKPEAERRKAAAPPTPCSARICWAHRYVGPAATPQKRCAGGDDDMSPPKLARF